MPKKTTKKAQIQKEVFVTFNPPLKYPRKNTKKAKIQKEVSVTFNPLKIPKKNHQKGTKGKQGNDKFVQ